MSEPNPCPECLMYGGFHEWSCQSVPDDSLVTHLRRYARTFLNGQERYRGALKRQQELTVFWHGKFSLVSHENNVLRRQLRRPIPETEEITPERENNRASS